MRVTNKMMTNNMLSSINRNKVSLSNLEQQYSSGKKIQKPSDDPIVAVRALKLRTNLDQLEQYHDKNIPDAMSWMDVTQGALDNINEILSQINKYCVQGSTDTLAASNRSDIVKNLAAKMESILGEGNANYAGRYVFTGYKTDSALTFSEKEADGLSYQITEKLNGKDIHIKNMVTGSYALEDFEDAAKTFDKAPQMLDTYQIQLSYDNLKSVQNVAVGGFSVNTVSVTAGNAYEPEAGKINFIPETGELILSKEAYGTLRTADDMKITYTKDKFTEGDIRPEHYFDCIVTDSENKSITYTKKNQEIQYEINVNQKLTVNTEASDAISMQMVRSIDEILNSVDDVVATENKIAEVKKRVKDSNLTDEQIQRYQSMQEQLETELVLKKEVMQKAFKKGITTSTQEQDTVNTASADLASRYNRLELTEDRMASQKVDYEELLSANEDVDLVDTIIKYSSAETIYNASLNAAAKIVQSSLLDFL